MSCANEIPMDKEELELLRTALNDHREKLYRHHRETDEKLDQIADLEAKLESWLFR